MRSFPPLILLLFVNYPFFFRGLRLAAWSLVKLHFSDRNRGALREGGESAQEIVTPAKTRA